MSLSPETRQIVEDLIVKSAMLVDRMELDAWVDTFEPQASYEVIPRENRDLGYPIALISCLSRDVLADRIMVLFKASKFNPHYDRHILSRTEIKGVDGDLVSTETTFMIVQSTMEGFSKLFCAGAYEDDIAVTDGIAKFRRRVAILDTFSVPNLIATPI